MLINALYLDEIALESYIAALEGGLRDSGSSSRSDGRGFGGSFSLSLVKADAHTDSGSQDTVVIKDHSAARLQRLISAGRERSDELAWVEVSQPDLDFSDIGIGSFVHWECEVYIPEFVSALTPGGDLNKAVQLFKGLAPSAQALGLDAPGMPSVEQLDAIARFAENTNIAPVVVGDNSETEWKVVGSLLQHAIRPEVSFDGSAIIIGKVKKRIPKDGWYPIVSLPGMNLVSREERRRRERKGPESENHKKQFIQGPALVVDYLAIYL